MKRYTNKQGDKQRIPRTGTRMTAPIGKLIEKMIAKGIAEKKVNRKGKPTIQGKANGK
jgi:hypothetical protein